MVLRDTIDVQYFYSQHIVGGILNTALNILILVLFSHRCPSAIPKILLYLVPIYMYV